ncbi:MAG: CDP-glucose 4,6-dehydratase [Syntrophomonas sp.]
MVAAFEEFYKDKKVLITGHTGFKGAWMALWLLHLGATVAGYALKPPTRPSFFTLCKLKNKLRHVNGDIRDYKKLSSFIKEFQPEIVIHMAAQSLVRESYEEPLLTYSTNVMGTVNLLEAARHCPSVQAVINVSSDKCYQNMEWVWGYRESDSLGGDDPYSSSKGCMELISRAYSHSYFNPRDYEQHGIALATVRAGNVIGGGDWAQDRLLPDLMRALIAGKPVNIRFPQAVRPWQHVLEALGAYLFLAQKLCLQGPHFGGAWNFGPVDEESKTVRWIVDYVIDHWGGANGFCLDNDNHPHESGHLALDCSKARKILGWSPVWNLPTALQNTITWYKAYINNEDVVETSLKQISDYEKALIGRKVD